MRTRSKLLLTALTAAFVMATAVSTASARQMTTSSQNSRAVWTPIEFTGLGGLIRIRCNVTLRGSFHYRTFSKTRSLVGYITSAALTRPCSGGEGWVLNGTERPTNTLPWHILYDSFTGTLPRIRGLRLAIVGMAFLIQNGFAACLYQSTSASPMFGIINLNEATGAGISLRGDESSSIPLNTSLSGSCPGSGNFAGTTSSLENGEGGGITIRLI